MISSGRDYNYTIGYALTLITVTFQICPIVTWLNDSFPFSAIQIEVARVPKEFSSRFVFRVSKNVYWAVL